MSLREELEAELAKAEADLTKAEVDLTKAESTFAQVDADPARPSATLDMARARCRSAQMRCDQLVIALTELSRAQLAGRSADETERLIKGMVGDLELGDAARPSDHDPSPRSTQRHQQPVPVAKEPQETISHVKRAASSFGLPLRIYSEPGAAPPLRLLARQSAMLFGLVLAYLQYYFADIHLQIALLPSVTTILPLG